LSREINVPGCCKGQVERCARTAGPDEVIDAPGWSPTICLDAAKKFLDAVAKVAPPAKTKSTAKAKASNVTRLPNEMEKLEREVAARPRAGSHEPRRRQHLMARRRGTATP
jgi:hypothetical protein